MAPLSSDWVWTQRRYSSRHPRWTTVGATRPGERSGSRRKILGPQPLKPSFLGPPPFGVGRPIRSTIPARTIFGPGKVPTPATEQAETGCPPAAPLDHGPTSCEIGPVPHPSHQVSRLGRSLSPAPPRSEGSSSWTNPPTFQPTKTGPAVPSVKNPLRPPRRKVAPATKSESGRRDWSPPRFGPPFDGTRRSGPRRSTMGCRGLAGDQVCRSVPRPQIAGRRDPTVFPGFGGPRREPAERVLFFIVFWSDQRMRPPPCDQGLPVLHLPRTSGIH